MGYCSRCGEITPADKCTKCGGRSVASIAANLGVEPILLADRWKSQYCTSILGFGDAETSAPSVLSEPQTCVNCHKRTLEPLGASRHCKDCTPQKPSSSSSVASAAVVDRGACSGCYRPILATETHVEHSSRFWHKECFSCHSCARSLGDTPMVDLQGHPCCESCLMAQAGRKPAPKMVSKANLSTQTTRIPDRSRSSRQSLPATSTSIRTNSPVFSPSPFGLNPRTSLYSRSKPFDSISSHSSSSSSASLSSTLSSTSWSPSPSPSKSAKPRVDNLSVFKRPISTTNESSYLGSPEPLSYPPSPPGWKQSTRKQNSALAEYRRAKAALNNEHTISQDNTLPSPSPSPPPRTPKILPRQPTFSKLPQSGVLNDPTQSNCSGCHNPLSGTRVKLSIAGGDVWYHYECLACETCHEPFSSSEYISDGKHFFHPKCRPTVQTPEYACHGCSKPITNKCLKNGSRLFHPDCFSCYECNSYLPFDEPFYEIQGEAHCEACSRMDNLSVQKEPQPPANPITNNTTVIPQESTRHSRNTLKLGGAKVCPHCRQSIAIMDEAPGPRATRWHRRCLQCQGCHKQMDSGANVVEGRSGEWAVWCRGCNSI
ncbi:hypothetical protein CLU79DRAFT_775055 [Phycomyces nitens]|nr:hypothetical protein CLU79DRAFT_775055 [Phycomyces nitens]